jgi:hypothetical protein
VIASLLAYLPLAMTTPFGHWTMVGPFVVQTARIGHYFIYFLAGIAVRRGRRRTGPDRSRGQAGQALVALADPGADPADRRRRGHDDHSLLAEPATRRVPGLFGGVAFALACATLSFAALATFLRFVRKTGPVARSLQANAYGMYLTHYVFTAWLAGCCCRKLGRPGQGLRGVRRGGGLSWLTTMVLRRMPLLGRIL